MWATQRLLPLVRGGEFARGLEASRRAALDLARRLEAGGRFVEPLAPELDIVVWAPRSQPASAASAWSQRIFDEAARRGLHLALTQLPVRFFGRRWPELRADGEHLLCLRSVLMKPEHEAWVGRIAEIAGAAAAATE